MQEYNKIRKMSLPVLDVQFARIWGCWPNTTLEDFCSLKIWHMDFKNNLSQLNIIKIFINVANIFIKQNAHFDQ